VTEADWPVGVHCTRCNLKNTKEEKTRGAYKAVIQILLGNGKSSKYTALSEEIPKAYVELACNAEPMRRQTRSVVEDEGLRTS
jgi:hypothetical protein